MSVSQYKPNECIYRIDKLDNVVYLIPEQALRNIKIDNGEAYIENIQYVPLMFNCYNISLEDTDTLDERYEFTHTLKFSVNGYVNHFDFQGCYYVIVKSVDNEYWLVNPLFPCKITYTYTLSCQNNHTDFTLSTVSNHPTLRIHNMNQGRAYPCNGYLLNSFDRLFLNEKMFSSHSGKDVYYTNSGFKEVIYDKKSATFQEQFDGDNVSHSIQFNIKFDDYKSSWHYNLLEFQDNLYAAIITTTKGEYVLCGFGFGLQPSYTVTSDGEMTPDHIEVRLVDMHDNGDLFTLVTGATISPNDEREYKFTLEYDAWECVSDGYAKYLLQKEVDVLGNPTGRYKCLEGYEESFAFLGDNLIGTFDEVVTFYQPQCKSSGCTLSTSLVSPVKMNAQQCKSFTVKADSDWSITNNASYLQVNPTSGSGGTAYTVQLCNNRPQSAETVTTSFTINYCSTAQTYTVQVGKGNGCFYGGDEINISPIGQYVTIPTECCIDSVLETTSALTNIQLFDTYIKVYVPQNNTESARTFTLDVTLCDGTDSEVTITQTNTYTRWVKEGTTCQGKLKCDVERMYSGTTSGDINTRTEVVRTTNCIDSADCGGSTTRWVETEETVCFEGRKYIVEKEQVKTSTDSDWIDTGNTRRGAETQDSPAECSGTTQYEYQWSATTGYVCSGTNKMTREIYQRRISGSSDPWENVVPTQERAAQPMIESASTDCGYVPPIEPIYKWENMNINTDYICDDCPIDYSKQYLTFVATERGKFSFSNSVSYSLDDGATWVNLSSNTQTPYIEANETIMWKANLIRNGNGIGHFSSTGMYEVNGNVMSLMYGDNFQEQVSLSGLSYQFAFLFQNSTKLVSAENFVLPSNELTTNCYEGMFENCTMLTKAPKLIATTLNAYCYLNMFMDCTSLTESPNLPATTLEASCYNSMFQGCTSLTTAPELPATTLANYCYSNMFYGCTSLTTAPSELPATTLASGCYSSMFNSCTALTTPPSVLPATRASSYCYYNMFVNCINITKSPDVMLTSNASYACANMFYGCSKLSYIKAMFLTTPSEYSGYLYWTLNWVYGVASEGIFVKNSAATWNVRGASGIPTNWTVILSD